MLTDKVWTDIRTAESKEKYYNSWNYRRSRNFGIHGKRILLRLIRRGSWRNNLAGGYAEHTYEMKEPTVAQKVNVRKEKDQITMRQIWSETMILFILMQGQSAIWYGRETGGVCNERSRTRAASGGFQEIVFTYRGELKSSTEAVVGAQAMNFKKISFTKDFSEQTVLRRGRVYDSDVGEAQVKQTAVQQCQKSYILAARYKFGNISAVTFAPFSGSVILTEAIDGYKENERLIVCIDKTILRAGHTEKSTDVNQRWDVCWF